MFDAKQFQKAQPLFDDFLRRHLSDPRAQEARVYSAICDYRQKRVTRALDSMSRVASMELMQKSSSPALLLALDQLALHHRTEGRPEDWRKTVDQLAEFFPDNLITLRELHVLAARHMNKGEFSQAIAAYARFEKQLNAEDRQNIELARAMAESGAEGYAIVKSANVQLEGNNPELDARRCSPRHGFSGWRGIGRRHRKRSMNWRWLILRFWNTSLSEITSGIANRVLMRRSRAGKSRGRKWVNNGAGGLRRNEMGK